MSKSNYSPDERRAMSSPYASGEQPHTLIPVTYYTNNRVWTVGTDGVLNPATYWRLQGPGAGLIVHAGSAPQQFILSISGEFEGEIALQYQNNGSGSWYAYNCLGRPSNLLYEPSTVLIQHQDHSRFRITSTILSGAAIINVRSHREPAVPHEEVVLEHFMERAMIVGINPNITRELQHFFGVLNLGPDDVLLLQCTNPQDTNSYAEMAQQLLPFLPHRNAVLIVQSMRDIQSLSQQEMEDNGWFREPTPRDGVSLDRMRDLGWQPIPQHQEAEPSNLDYGLDESPFVLELRAITRSFMLSEISQENFILQIANIGPVTGTQSEGIPTVNVE